MVPLAPTRPAHVAALGADGDPALVTAAGTVTHGELRDLVRARVVELRSERRVRVLPMRNDLESVVEYLATHSAGHVPLPVSPEDPGAAAELERRFAPATELHPELALLLSTSGSTGSPKLVRLSASNLTSNADAISDYLRIGPDERALLTLPMHYSYGLSVLHSHLRAGAAVVLTPTSVVDPCTWELAAAAGVTSFAGVPHTFDLIGRGGLVDLLPVTLRTVTQAGGRLRPESVRDWARRGAERGFDFVVMYGATEATARMAWLPPELAERRPETIGGPIPGGSFRLEEPDSDGIGELVYSGPNVMMGYAVAATDLARGAGPAELHTGDLARRADDGLWEVVGRASRIVKPFGLRIDLDHLGDRLADRGIEALCGGTDELLAVAVTDPSALDRATAAVGDVTGLPSSHIVVGHVAGVPLTPTGKPDARAATEPLLELARPQAPGGRSEPGDGVAGIYSRHLAGRRVGGDDTFVALGGDSLTYIEVSVELEELLGRLPPDWHLRTVDDLDALPRPERTRPRPAVRMEVGAVLRALGIVAVLGRHVGLFAAAGGAHVLMALSGHNFSRFPLTAMAADGRPARLWSALGRVAAPAAAWIAVVVAVGTVHDGWSGYSGWNVVFANTFTAEPNWGDPWRYWYVEALVHILAVAALAFSLRPVRRLVAAHPFRSPLLLVVPALVLRFGIVEVGPQWRQLNIATGVAWLFLLGWAAHRADSTSRRLLVSALVLVSVPGWFADTGRELTVVAALLAIVWLREVWVPRPLVGVIGTLGSASLWIYLTHWQVYPPLEDTLHPALLVLLCAAVGVLAWSVWEAASHWVVSRQAYGVWASRRRRTLSDPVAETSSKSPEPIAGR